MQVKSEGKADKKETFLTIDGEGNSFGNALRGELIQNKSVAFAAAKVEHPLKKVEFVSVKVSKGTANGAVIDAAANIAKKSRDFSKKFSDEYK